MDKYKEINKQSWNKRVGLHLDSEFYDNKSFLAGRNTLPAIDQELLKGIIKGKSVLHLQCHFGQDTVSLERLGAARVVGVDLSDVAIKTARAQAKEVGSTTEYVESDIYELVDNLDERFDIVYTSYGTIGWLPDLHKWAAVINQFLKPGGVFFLAEFHPLVWMYDDDFTKVEYSYFNSDFIHSKDEGSYAGDSKEEIEYVVWNHPLSEVFSALLSQNLTIKHFDEYDYSAYDCFKPGIKIAEGKYRIKHLDAKIPMMYTLIAEKE